MNTVYFIRARHGGPIKIGITCDLCRRLDEMQLHSPYELEVVAALEGDHALEKRFHAHLAELNVRREWYAPTQSLLSLVRSINDGSFSQDILPEKGKHAWAIRRAKETA